jgi:hypothetical protein
MGIKFCDIVWSIAPLRSVEVLCKANFGMLKFVNAFDSKGFRSKKNGIG